MSATTVVTCQNCYKEFKNARSLSTHRYRFHNTYDDDNSVSAKASDDEKYPSSIKSEPQDSGSISKSESENESSAETFKNVSQVNSDVEGDSSSSSDSTIKMRKGNMKKRHILSDYSSINDDDSEDDEDDVYSSDPESIQRKKASNKKKKYLCEDSSDKGKISHDKELSKMLETGKEVEMWSLLDVYLKKHRIYQNLVNNGVKFNFKFKNGRRVLDEDASYNVSERAEFKPEYEIILSGD